MFLSVICSKLHLKIRSHVDYVQGCGFGEQFCYFYFIACLRWHCFISITELIMHLKSILCYSNHEECSRIVKIYLYIEYVVSCIRYCWHVEHKLRYYDTTISINATKLNIDIINRNHFLGIRGKVSDRH